MKQPTAICLLLLLSACGGGSDSSSDMPPNPAPVADTFYARVTGFVGLTSEDGDAADVNAVAVTEPENTEPSGL